MGKNVIIKADGVQVTATLNTTATAQAIWEALPLSGEANRWGDEVYFAIPLKLKAEAQQEVLEAGDLGYWPPGQAFCIFFGPTPASQGEEIRPASAVNVFGSVTSHTDVLKEVKQGAAIIIERTPQA